MLNSFALRHSRSKKLSLFRRKQRVKHEFKSTTISRQLISASPARLKYVIKDREKKSQADNAVHLEC